MSDCLLIKNAGGGSSSDCTASKAKVLSGKTAVTSDSDDEPIAGTLFTTNGTAATNQVYPGKTFYNNDPLTKRTGNLAANNVTGFAASNYATGQILISWTRPSSNWSGIRIGYKTGGYPTSYNDGNAQWAEVNTINKVYSGLTKGTTYYFRGWSYLTTSAGRIYNNSYVSAAMAAPNNAGTKTITSTQNWTVPAGVRTVSVFCVGGGGGGSSNYSSPAYGGGGGGGGCTAYKNNISVNPGAVITCTIGGGGAGKSGNGQGGNNGGTTSFGSYCSASGGNGGFRNTSYKFMCGGNGGSGGGGASTGYNNPGAGGTNGGAGGDGVHGSYTNSKGGTGQGGTTRPFGASTGTVYAGGGGGGNYKNQSSGGAGGTSGGGKGGSSGNGTNGTANTGGGGGGAGGNNSYVGGNGGTGVIIINYS